MLYQLSYFRIPPRPEGLKVWAKMDSNHRRHKPADLQSAPFGHSGIRPFNQSFLTLCQCFGVPNRNRVQSYSFFPHSPNFFTTFFKEILSTNVQIKYNITIKHYKSTKLLHFKKSLFSHSSKVCHSTVTDFARFRGISTSFPLLMAI